MKKIMMWMVLVSAALFAAQAAEGQYHGAFQNALCREDLDCDTMSPTVGDFTCVGMCEVAKCDGAADVDFSFGFQYTQCWNQRNFCVQFNPDWQCQAELQSCIAVVRAAQEPECQAVRDQYEFCMLTC